MQKRVTLKYSWAIVLISIATAIGLNNMILSSGLAALSPGYLEATENIYSIPFGSQLLYTGILIPILEELIFRGGVFRLLRRWMNFPFAMILSALIFGIYHWNLVQFVYATLCGLLLAYLCEIFGTVFASIMAHMSMNLTACVFTAYGIFNRIFEEKIYLITITILCLIFFGVLFYYIQKMSKNWMLQNC